MLRATRHTPWRVLAEASAALDSSLNFAETLRNVVDFLVPRMADYSAIALVDDAGDLHWHYSAHRDPAKADLAAAVRSYPPKLQDPANPIAQSFRDQETIVIKEVDDTFTRHVARDERHLALLRELDPTSVIYAYLATRNRIVGLLLFCTTSASNRRYTDRDIAMAKEIGRRVAMAVDHALLFRKAEQAVAARDELMAIVSHDLKNPVSTIQMAVSFLLEELLPDDAAHAVARGQLAAIHRSTERMRRLITDLLNVAAIEAGQLVVVPEPVSVDDVVAEAVDILNPLARARGITMVSDVAPGLPTILVDRERLLQIFTNLCGNAIKFTRANGRIGIAAIMTGDGVEFSVSDSGSGIAPEHLPHVFDRFWQARDTARLGTGLGLSIVKALVEAHGGRIRAESIVGQGSTFTFSIPVSPQEAPRPIA